MSLHASLELKPTHFLELRENMRMEVRILSRKLITPSTPTPPHLQNLKLSSIDQLLFPAYVPLIFYYTASGEGRDGYNLKRSEQLQKALSETLTLFYPLAGRYSRGSLFIDCNDMGAEYLEAQVRGCLSNLLTGGALETELRNQLVPGHIQPDNSPLVTVQFNMFECGGLAIGICVTHTIADAFTIFTFINALATACRIGIDEVHKPIFQLGSLCPPRDISYDKAAEIRFGTGSTENVMKRFVFTGATISRLKEVVASAIDKESQKHQPTRIEVVVALIWKTFTTVAQTRHGHYRPSILFLSLNMRGRIGFPLGEYSCGNFATGAIAHFMPDDENKVQLHDFIGRVHDAIKNTITDCSKASNGDDLFSMVNNCWKLTSESFGKSEVDVHTFTSWCRFPIYEANFGWGKPDWVTGMHAPSQIVLLLDTKDGDGIEAWIGLDVNDMLLFEQNPDIVAFTGQELQRQST